MTTPIAIPLRVSKKKTNVKKGGKAQMSNLTPKQMWDIIQKQSAKLQQKNRMIKCLRSALQRSNERSKQFEKKLRTTDEQKMQPSRVFCLNKMVIRLKLI